MITNPARLQRNPRLLKRRRQRGAAIVEFALIVPFLLTILFAVIEFSVVFSQVLDMRHGAREGARLAAVDFDSTGSGVPATQTNELVTEICSRIDDPTVTRVTLTFPIVADTGVGDFAYIKVDRDLSTITGFFDTVLTGVQPSSDVVFRLEQNAGWAATTDQACP